MPIWLGFLVSVFPSVCNQIYSVCFIDLIGRSACEQGGREWLAFYTISMVLVCGVRIWSHCVDFPRSLFLCVWTRSPLNKLTNIMGTTTLPNHVFSMCTALHVCCFRKSNFIFTCSVFVLCVGSNRSSSLITRSAPRFMPWKYRAAQCGLDISIDK